VLDFYASKLSYGLKINLTKSELVLVGIVDNVEGLASIFGYGVSSLPLKYLGHLLGAPIRPNQFEMGSLKR